MGKSKMNFVLLVTHGLSAMAVYSDIIMVQLMLAASALIGLTLLGILGVVGALSSLPNSLFPAAHQPSPGL